MSMKRLNTESTLEQDKVALSEIYVDDAQNMRRFPVAEAYIKDLAASISSLGQLQPVVVKPYNGEANGNDTGDFKYTLVAGYCRYKALETLDYPVLVRVVEPEDLGAIFANIAENIKRKDTSFVDLSYAIGKLKDGESSKDDEGTVTVTRPAMPLKDISKEIGISAGMCSELDKIRLLRTPIQKKIHTGDITWKLVRVLVTVDEAKQDELLAQAESGEISQTALAEHFGDKRRATKKKKAGKKGKGGGGDGDGEGEEGEGGGGGGREKKPVSAKKALLVLDELAAKPGKDEEGNAIEETYSQTSAREVFTLVRKFMNGKLGQQALQKNVVKLFSGE